MFKLHRHRAGKPGEKVEFKFSRFRASQVPKGWDKLFLSIISVATGKTIAKSSKALVDDGSCQWTEALSECIWLAQDGVSKELEERILKFIVSMGSARSNNLGEATLNLTDHVSPRDAVPVSLPLTKCSYGTILQFNIQCLTPRTKFRDGRHWKETTSHVEDLNMDSDGVDNKSDESDIMLNRSIGSSSSNHLVGSPFADEPGNKDINFSASGSHHSSDSGESFIGRTNFSPRNNLNGTHSQIGRQDSTGSQGSSAYGAVDDISRSNSSSFNSRAAASGAHVSSPWQDRNADSHMASLRHTDSSKELLEAAQETIEELRGEARLWERNARKLKTEHDSLKKEFSDQSSHQADRDMQLKAASMERDNLKLEVEQLKSSMEELQAKETISDTKFQAEDQIHKHKELEDELRFHKESNASLCLQLKKTQESNIELVSILQELEETIEKQRLEIANLSEQRPEIAHKKGNGSHSLLDIEPVAAHSHPIEEENMVHLVKGLPDLQGPQDPINTGFCSGSDTELIKEIDTLKIKIQELERDCAELTEENLELILKMKESKEDIIKRESYLGCKSEEFQSVIKSETSLGCAPEVFLGKLSSVDPGSEIFQSMPKMYQLAEELVDKEVQSRFLTEPFIVQFKELEKKCADLEVELQAFKDKASSLDTKFCESQKELEQKSIELCEMRKRLKNYQEVGVQNTDGLPGITSQKSEPGGYTELSMIFPKIYEQLRLFLLHMKKNSLMETENEMCLDMIPGGINSVTQREWTEVIMRNLLQLNNLLETKNSHFKDMFPEENLGMKHQSKNLSGMQNLIKGYILKEEHEKLMMELESTNKDLNRELLAYKSDMEDMKATILLKEEGIDILGHSKQEIKDLLYGVLNEEKKLEEDFEFAFRESEIPSKCLGVTRKEMMVLTGSMDSHLSANKYLERKSQELESSKHELELHITELEQENVELSERISGLEAQLRYLTNEKESSRLELENSKSIVMNLKDEIGKLGTEMEKQKEESKQKLQETHRRLSEAVEESEYLKRSHSKLQATVESLIEESSCLQKLTSDLKRQKLELHERSTFLEVELSESQKRNADFVNKIEILEVKLSLLQKDTSLKEKSLLSEVNAIFQKQKEHEEKLNQANALLNQMGLDKEDEMENLQQEVSHLNAQLSSTHDERERIASGAVREVSKLRADKIKLESSLHEIQAKVKSYEMEIYNTKQESSNTIQGLISLLNASKQSEEMLMADIEHRKRYMDNIKSGEGKLKKLANELELKLKSSEYEREQLSGEVSELKAQLVKITNLQGEIVALKSSLDETKFEKAKLEESLQLISEECEKLKSECSSYMEKISTMQKALFDVEDDRRSRVALEEKLLRLECDLNARDALYAQDIELKNELNRIKRTNSQYQRKIQCVEEERDELTRKFQVLEKDFKTRKAENQDEKRLLPEGDKSQHHHIGRPQSENMDDLESKVSSLETKLADAIKTNNMYKLQLERFMFERQTTHSNACKGSTIQDVRVEGHDERLMLLEAELKDMRERYSQMSLKFAEVEGQREELVMKLKSVKKEKRWF
uniref:Myosin-11 n=1 Tax=Anthurium amnicola TaxID=1678845 RepID=A0A1D1Y5T4_9ARAE